MEEHTHVQTCIRLVAGYYCLISNLLVLPVPCVSVCTPQLIQAAPDQRVSDIRGRQTVLCRKLALQGACPVIPFPGNEGSVGADVALVTTLKSKPCKLNEEECTQEYLPNA